MRTGMTGVIFLLGIAVSPLVFASSFEFDVFSSPTTSSSGLIYTHPIDRYPALTSLKDFNLNYTRSVSLPDPTSTTGSWYETNAITAGLDWKAGQKKLWTLSLDGNYSNQPTQNFTTNGIEFDFARKFEFDPEADDFSQALSIGFKLGENILTQKAIQKNNAILRNDLSEPQLKTGINLRYNYIAWGAIYTSYNGYKYNPSISNLVAYLNKTHPVAEAGMSTALGQLNAFDWTTKLLFYIGDSWEIDSYEQIEDGLTTGTTSYLYETDFIYKITKEFEVLVGGGVIYPTSDAQVNFALTYNW
jgi:hypothetical protein